MKKQRDREAERVLYIIGWIAIIVILLAGLILKILNIDLLHTSLQCVFYERTGYYCPGCGGTRATFFFLQGHLVKSLYYHPLVPYLGLGGGLYMISHTLYYLSKGKIEGIRFRNIYAYLMIIIVIVQFIYKNALIYFFQFYMLK